MGRKLPKTIEKKGHTVNRAGQIASSSLLFMLVCLSILVIFGVFFSSESLESGNPVVTENSSPSTSSRSFDASSEELAKSLERSDANLPAETDANPVEIDQSIFETALVVEVAGFDSKQGDCLVAIYDSSTSFNKIDQSIIRESKKIEGDSIQFEFAIFGNKPIAIAAFHDENRNGMLDKNAFGIPMERYGFSNNPPSAFGPPSFNAAAIQDPKQANGRIKILLSGLNLSGSK
ncbi:MAG: DUF2141 domain-containing protein [Planctomycetota bacterium]|nr:DUF2141 domain-containing protein [Planctomycetota bacterium]